MAPNKDQDFENLSFNAFNSENVLDVNNSSDPDVNFLNLVPKEQTTLKYRSLDKDFENPKTFLADSSFRFQIICLTESRSSANSDNENNYGLS